MITTISRRDATRLSLAAFCGAALLRYRAAFAQSTAAQATPPPQFDVSTVKPSNPDGSGTDGITTRAGAADARNVTLQRCIIGAYSVGPHQVIGGPDWVYSDRWDILAKSDQPIGDDDVLNKMLQALLADRFQLTLHRETRTLPAYALEVDKQGPKLSQAKGGDSSTNTYSRVGRVTIDAKNTDMNLLAQLLARKLDLPVVNQTGLTGIFDFKLVWLPDDAQVPMLNGAPDPNAPPGIFTAIQEQLGLHLRATKASVEVLAIDHAEKPVPN